MFRTKKKDLEFGSFYFLVCLKKKRVLLLVRFFKIADVGCRNLIDVLVV